MRSSSRTRRPGSPRSASAVATRSPSRWSGCEGARRGGCEMSTMTEAVPRGPSAAVKRVAVVGGGTMGNGIAQVFATAGFEVELIDMKPEFVERALGTIGKNLERVAKKQSWQADQATGILRRIHGGVELSAVGDC